MIPHIIVLAQIQDHVNEQAYTVAAAGCRGDKRKRLVCYLNGRRQVLTFVGDIKTVEYDGTNLAEAVQTYNQLG